MPAEIVRLLGEHDRVAFVYFDAFGWRLAERHGEHPLLRRARVERWRSQFPSTTTVHTTTIHTGLPVAEHGLYEWHVYEPRLDRLITPLLFCFAGDNRRDTLLTAGLTPEELFPFETLYERLDVPAHAAMPRSLAHATPNVRLLRGATVHPFHGVDEGVERLCGALAAEERAYGTIYLAKLDALQHVEGPQGPGVDPLVEATLTALDEAPWPEGTLVLLTADHGMAAISPERTTYVNLVWPELARHLVPGADGKPLAPAGSARDLFLHVLPDRLDDVAAELRRRLEGKAEVRRTDDGLFAAGVGEALRARLANLVVLPGPGEAVFWFEEGRFEQPYYGQHGGLSADELEIPLVAWIA